MIYRIVVISNDCHKLWISDHTQNWLRVYLHEESFTGKLFKHRCLLPSGIPKVKKTKVRKSLISDEGTRLLVRNRRFVVIFFKLNQTSFLCLN